MGAQVGKACCSLTGRGGVLEEAARAVADEMGPEATKIVDCITGEPDASRAARKVSQVCVPLKGRHRSLLVGINYRGTQNELHGCVNDVHRMIPIIEKLGFRGGADQQCLLLDEANQPEEKLPTRANMLKAFKWLVDGAQTGDALFFHYSGHGGQQPSANGSYDETLVPLDFESKGMLLDTELFEELVRPLPSGCRLTCILDSCHSAGALNLPFIVVGNEAELKQALAGQAVQMVMARNWGKDLEEMKDGRPQAFFTDAGHMGLALWQLKQQADAAKGGDDNGFAEAQPETKGLAVGEVIAITGCRSDQTSADVGDVSAQFGIKEDTNENNTGAILSEKAQHVRGGDYKNAGGALTTALVEVLQNGVPADLSYFGVLEKIRQELSAHGFSQVPQVATSLVVDLQKQFALDTIFLPAPADAAGESNDATSQPIEQETGKNGNDGKEKPVEPSLDAFLQSISGHPEGANMIHQAV